MEVLEFVAILVALAGGISGALALWSVRHQAPPGPVEVVEGQLLANPGGCTKESHVWRKRAHLRSDHEDVYYCSRNCGSTLRHRFE